jgi:hypothetical protein
VALAPDASSSQTPNKLLYQKGPVASCWNLKGTLDVEPCQSGEAHEARRHGSSHVREMPDFDPNWRRSAVMHFSQRMASQRPFCVSSTNGTSCVYRTDRTNLAMHQHSHVLNYVDSCVSTKRMIMLFAQT